MLTAPERKVMIARIKEVPKAVQEAVKGLSKEQLNTPYREGGWTVAQVVHHLADSHMNAYIRMRLALTEDHPTIKPYNQDAWAALADSKSPAVAPSLAILKGLHKRWVAMLKKVGRKEWGRKAMHPERGEMTMDDFLTMYSGHGENHVNQIKKLRQARGW